MTPVTVGAEFTAADAAAADFSQASYFRAFLEAEHGIVAEELQASRSRLQACIDDGQVIGLRAMARARFEVRELEGRKRELDRMIAALDCRFSGLRSRQG